MTGGHRSRLLLLVLLALTATVPAASAGGRDQGPENKQLADVARGPASSSPGDFQSVGSEILFTAAPGYERHLWRAPRAGGAATRLTDESGRPFEAVAFEPGPAGLHFADSTSSELRTSELWWTDGTQAGTTRVRGLCEATPSCTILSMARLGERTLIQTEDGLYEAADRRPTEARLIERGIVLDLDDSAEVDGRLVLPSLDQSDASAGPWVTDGTAAGTQEIADIDDTGATNGPAQFTEWNGDVYFVSRSGYDTALFRLPVGPGGSFGAPEALVSSSAGFRPSALTPIGDSLLFFNEAAGLGGALWRSDGTASGTREVGVQARGYRLVRLGDIALFDGTTEAFGREVWRTDGTAAGTTLVRDIAPGSVYAQPSEMVRSGSRIYFTAFSPRHGRELWSSNGTRRGTSMTEIAPGSSSSSPRRLSPYRNGVLLAATGGEKGLEPWFVR